MKIKVSRRVVGTFAEVSNLVRSLTQLLSDHIGDTSNPYWKWLLLIRQYLRFVSMPAMSDSQVWGQPTELTYCLLSRYHVRYFQQLPHQMIVQLNGR